jgi:MgtC family protein
VRTLGLVCLGSALAVLSIHAATGTEESRVIQGIVTGVGFLGAGVIVRSEKGQHVHGLTTAACVCGDRVRGRGLRDCAMTDRRGRGCAGARHSRVRRAVRKSNRPALAGATEPGFGSAA